MFLWNMHDSGIEYDPEEGHKGRNNWKELRLGEWAGDKRATEDLSLTWGKFYTNRKITWEK